MNKEKYNPITADDVSDALSGVITKYSTKSDDYPYLSWLQANDLAQALEGLGAAWRREAAAFMKSAHATPNDRFEIVTVYRENQRASLNMAKLREVRPDLAAKYGCVDPEYAVNRILGQECVRGLLVEAGVSEEDLFSHTHVTLGSVQKFLTDAERAYVLERARKPIEAIVEKKNGGGV